MNKITLTIIITLFILNTNAQTSLPYYTSFNDAEAIKGWKSFMLGKETSSLPNWSFSSKSLTHDYPVGGTKVTDDWMVSPLFDFSAGATIDSIKYSFSGFGTPMGIDTIAMYLITGNQDPSKASSKKLIRLYTDKNYKNDNTWRTDKRLLLPKTKGKSYIAFRFKTIVNWLYTKFDNLYISSNSSRLNPKTSNNIVVYPNPTNKNLFIKVLENTKVKSIQIVDLTGKSIREFTPSSRILNTEKIVSGNYLLRIITISGVVNKKIILL